MRGCDRSHRRTQPPRGLGVTATPVYGRNPHGHDFRTYDASTSQLRHFVSSSCAAKPQPTLNADRGKTSGP